MKGIYIQCLAALAVISMLICSTSAAEEGKKKSWNEGPPGYGDDPSDGEDKSPDGGYGDLPDDGDQYPYQCEQQCTPQVTKQGGGYGGYNKETGGYGGGWGGSTGDSGKNCPEGYKCNCCCVKA